MGTWGSGIEDDDVFHDVYQDFIDMYNQGYEPDHVAVEIRDQFEFHFANPDDYAAALFALALASWETQVLETDLLTEVREYIASDKDLDNLRSRDATERHIAERRESLRKFVEKIEVQRSSKKRRVKPKDLIVRMVELMSPDNRKEILASKSYLGDKYFGTVVVLVWRERGGGGMQLLEIMDESLIVKAHWKGNLELQVDFSHSIDVSGLPGSVPFYGDKIRVIYEVES